MLLVVVITVNTIDIARTGSPIVVNSVERQGV
jgi:hypothetical protein